MVEKKTLPFVLWGCLSIGDYNNNNNPSSVAQQTDRFHYHVQSERHQQADGTTTKRGGYATLKQQVFLITAK